MFKNKLVFFFSETSNFIDIGVHYSNYFLDIRSPVPQCPPTTVVAALPLVLLFGQPAASACPLSPHHAGFGGGMAGDVGRHNTCHAGGTDVETFDSAQASHFGRIEFTSAKARDFPGVFFSSILTSEYPPLQEVVTRKTSGGSMESCQGALAVPKSPSVSD